VEKLKGVWLDELKADKELGGENLAANVEPARRLLDKFGSNALKKTLDETGLGNHPELVRLLAGIAKAVGPDKLVLAGSEGGQTRKSVEELFYGSK
jgi:hypothetical protein